MPQSRSAPATDAVGSPDATPLPLHSLITAGPIPWSDESEWVLPAVQERSRNTLRKIVSAAADLFVSDGYEETTIVAIGLRAGVGVGTIYKRFPDKRAILNAVLTAYEQTRSAEIAALCAEETWRWRTPHDIVALHMEIIFSSVVHDEGILRLLERLRVTEPGVAAMLIDWNDQVSDRIARLLLLQKAKLPVADLAGTVRYIHNLIRGSLVWAILPKHPVADQPLVASDPGVKSSAYRIALSCLGLAA